MGLKKLLTGKKTERFVTKFARRAGEKTSQSGLRNRLKRENQLLPCKAVLPVMQVGFQSLSENSKKNLFFFENVLGRAVCSKQGGRNGFDGGKEGTVACRVSAARNKGGILIQTQTITDLL
jgi:hypothetical protein